MSRSHKFTCLDIAHKPGQASWFFWEATRSLSALLATPELLTSTQDPRRQRRSEPPAAKSMAHVRMRRLLGLLRTA